MNKGKIFAFVGMAVIGLSAVLFISQTQAQSTTPFQCGQIKDLVSSNQPWGSGGVYVSAGGTRIGKILDGRLQHDSYTSVNGVGKSVSPGIVKIGSGNTTGQFDFWIVCSDGQMVQVYMPSISAGYGLCVATDGSTYYIPPTPPYNSEQGSCSTSIFTSANLEKGRANDGSGTTPRPPPLDLTPPAISAVNATDITQTGATITWTTDENSNSQVEYGTTASYGSITALDTAMVTAHTVNLTGLAAGTAYNFKVQSKDTAGNLAYISQTFTTLAAPTYTFALTKVDATLEAKIGTTAWIKFNLKNNSTTQIDFSVNCDSGNGAFLGNMYNLNADGTIGEKFVNPGAYSNPASAPSANAVIAAGAEKSFQFKFDIPASVAVRGPWTAKCHTYPKDNSTGNSLTDKKQEITNTLTVIAVDESTTTVSATALTQYGTNKYSIKVEDGDGLREFSVKTLGTTANPTGRSMYSGSPGAAGNVGACSGTNPFKTLDSGTVTIESNEWPLNFTVTDCKANVKIGNVSPPGGIPPPPTPPPTEAPVAPSGLVATVAANGGDVNLTWTDNSTNETEFRVYRRTVGSADWTFDGPTGAGQTSYTDMYVPAGSHEYKITAAITASGAITLESAPSNFYSVVTKGGGTTPPDDHADCDMTMYSLKDGKYIDDKGGVGPTTESLTGIGKFYKWLTDHYHLCSTTTPPPPPPPDDTTPRACKPGEECPKGSWCESGGQQCYSPDSKLTCVPRPTPASGMSTPTYGGSTTRCLPGTQPCRPEDMTGTGSRCLNPGLDNKVKYFPSGSTSGGTNYWCGGGSQQLYSKTKNIDGSYYMICLYSDSDETPPAGYQACRPEDNGCKQKPDQWTAEEEKSQMGSGSFYCMNSQKCTLKSGGGKCVGWNDSCGENAVYCPQNPPSMTGSYTSKCGEPETFTEIDSSSGQSFWCGGGGTAFYSKTKAYCSQKKVSSPPDYGMFTGAEIKAILEKLGSGWKLCNPYSNTGSAMYSSKCLEPGEKGSSSDWCAWNPPSSIMGYTPPPNGRGTRICPSLDAVITPPPPPPDDEKHKYCGMTMYIKNEKGLMVDKETGVPAPIPASKKGYITDFKWVDDHYHLCDTPIGEPPPPPPPTPEFRECRPGEIPSATNNCMLPSYRWVIADKKWEKCPFTPPNPLIMKSASMPLYIDIMNHPDAKTTNCQSMNFEIEEPWRTLRYLTRPPQKFGEWYMPPWDASALMKQYDPKTDRFEECRKTSYRSIMPYPDEWYAPCTSVPETDEKWLLAMNRAQYKLHQLYQQNRPFPPGLLPPDVPLPPEPPKPEQPIPEIPVKQCKQYLIGIKNGLNGDKQFWKEVKRQTSVLPADHPDLAAINKLLDDAKKLIQEAEGVTRLGRCEKEPLTKVKELTEKLHNEIFAELSSYLGAVHDYVELGFCTAKLGEGAKRLKELVGKADDNEMKEEFTEFADEIEEKISEFNEKTDDFEFDVVFECREYLNEVEPRIAALTREGDHEVREIVERVIAKELQPFIEQLKEESAARKERIETLLVQVAQLQQSVAELRGAAQDLKKRAEEMTNQVAVSLKQLSYIEEKFEKERTEIEASKSKLVVLVERMIALMGERSCLRGPDQEHAFRIFERATAVNWIGYRADELERRFNGWMTACERKELTREDIERLALAVDEAANLNQRDSFEKGLTPCADVATHEWYFGGISTGYKTGFITQCRPGDQVLRQDALLMILRVKGLTDAEIKGDCEIPKESSVINASPYARCAVVQSLKRGLIVRGDVAVPVQRGEIASWIAALELVPEISETHTAEIQASYQDLKRGVLSEWISAIARLVDAKVMVGVVTADSAKWQPFDNLTRAALAVVLEQLARVNAPPPSGG